MLAGVGSLMLGDTDFSTEVLSLCSSSFVLTFEYDTFGYSYLNSSNKMMMPAIDNFDAKQKSWAIELDFSVISKPIWDSLQGSTSNTLINNYFNITAVIGLPSTITVPLAIGAVSNIEIFNQSTNVLMAQVSSPSNANQFSIAGQTITFHSSAVGNVVCLLVRGGQTAYDISYISNKIFSFSGILYSVEKQQSFGVYAKEIQIEKYPGFALNQDQAISFNVLNELKIFKI